MNKELRRLGSDEIESLAGRNDVRRIAVENFLMTVSNNDSLWIAEQNMMVDSRLYKWDLKTIKAISEGIRLATIDR